MARPKSDFISALGVFFEIARSLVNEVMNLGGSDDHIRRILTDETLRTQIARLIVMGGVVQKSATAWVLDWHTRQHTDVITGLVLERYYDSPEFNGRLLSIDSPLVKGWLANPLSYPEDLKKKLVCLWGSRQHSGDTRQVSCLSWSNHEVRVRTHDLSAPFYREYCALLVA